MLNKPGIHGRDHCPGGADPIPCLVRAQYAEFSFSRDLGSGVPVNDFLQGFVEFDHFKTSDQTLFATAPFPGTVATNAAGDQFVMFLQPCLFFAEAALRWEAVDFASRISLKGGSSDVPLGHYGLNFRLTTNYPSTSDTWVNAAFCSGFAGDDSNIGLTAIDASLANHKVEEAYLQVIAWTVSPDFTIDPIY